uniref:Flavin-containing monooxygenase n=1 Tax=Aegilops tauschii subsp. strangulata TaxID=200361 RepID=A0A453ISB7_AEGTS
MVPTRRSWTRTWTRCSTPSSSPPATTRSQDCQASKAWRRGGGGRCTATRTGCRSRSAARWWWWSGAGRAAKTSPWRSAAWPRRCTSSPGPWRRSPQACPRCWPSTAPTSISDLRYVHIRHNGGNRSINQYNEMRRSSRPARQVERLCEDGRVAFKDGGGSSSSVAADTVIYCTGYSYSFPFLETGGAVTVDDNRVGPLFEHVFPPSLAPSLSFVGVPRKIFAPRFFEIQARWVAQVLSGRRALPAEEEMRRSVEEFYRARDAAGVPRKYTHEIGRREPTVRTLLRDHATKLLIDSLIVVALIGGVRACSTWTISGRSTATSLAWRGGGTSCWGRSCAA